MAKKIGTRPTPAKPAKGMTQRPNVNIQRSCGADYSRDASRATRATNSPTEAHKSTRR